MQIPKIPIEKINKMPLAYALMIMGGLLGIVASKYFNNNEKVIEAYKLENASLRAENALKDRKCDSVAGFWQSKYVVSLEKQTERQRKQDSTDKATLRKPNRDLLKIIKTKKDE